MESVTKEQFDKLWSINPTFSDPDHNYENTFLAINQRLIIPNITPDGQLVTFDLIYQRYKSYYQIKTIINEGTEAKYIKKENVIAPIYRYIRDAMYESVEKIPHTQRHFYFWGDKTEGEIKDKYKIFLQLCQK